MFLRLCHGRFSAVCLRCRIAADIFSRIGKDGVTDDDAQEAIWSLFEPADQKTAEDKKLIHEALEDIKDGIPVRLMRGNTRTTRLRIVRRAKVGYRRTLSPNLTVLQRRLQCLSRQHYS